MTSKLDPQELERLAQVARRRHYIEQANTPYGVMPSREFGQIARVLTAIAYKLRAGQLVPTMPSGDVVEAVAMSLAEFECANWDAQSFNETPAGETPDEMRRGYLAKATAAITTYEAVSGVAKMRESLRAVNDAETQSSWEAAVDELIEAARAALGEKP